MRPAARTGGTDAFLPGAVLARAAQQVQGLLQQAACACVTQTIHQITSAPADGGGARCQPLPAAVAGGDGEVPEGARDPVGHGEPPAMTFNKGVCCRG